MPFVGEKNNRSAPVDLNSLSKKLFLLKIPINYPNESVKLLEKKVNYYENKNKEYLAKIAILEKEAKINKIKNKLLNSPKINLNHAHKDRINTMIIVHNDTIITGSKDKSIRGLPLREKEIKIKTFEINYAHEGEVTYLMNLYHDEIISCGVDGRIKRWYNRNSDFEGF